MAIQDYKDTSSLVLNWQTGLRYKLSQLKYQHSAGANFQFFYHRKFHNLESKTAHFSNNSFFKKAQLNLVF
jgi:hypothetical protein